MFRLNCTEMLFIVQGRCERPSLGSLMKLQLCGHETEMSKMISRFVSDAERVSGCEFYLPQVWFNELNLQLRTNTMTHCCCLNSSLHSNKTCKRNNRSNTKRAIVRRSALLNFCYNDFKNRERFIVIFAVQKLSNDLAHFCSCLGGICCWWWHHTVPAVHYKINDCMESHLQSSLQW